MKATTEFNVLDFLPEGFGISDTKCQCGRNHLLTAPSGKMFELCHQCEQEKALKELKVKMNNDFESACMGREYAHMEWADYIADSTEKSNALNICREYASNYNPGQCLLMVGNQGTGKSLLAHLIKKTLIRQGKTVEYMLADDIYNNVLTCIQAGVNPDSVIKAVMDNDVIIIDEIGRSPATERANSFFFKLIEKAKKIGRGIVLVSNCSLDTNSDRHIGRYLDLDRMRDRTIWRHVVFNWESHRSKKK